MPVAPRLRPAQRGPDKIVGFCDPRLAMLVVPMFRMLMIGEHWRSFAVE